ARVRQLAAPRLLEQAPRAPLERRRVPAEGAANEAAGARPLGEPLLDPCAIEVVARQHVVDAERAGERDVACEQLATRCSFSDRRRAQRFGYDLGRGRRVQRDSDVDGAQRTSTERGEIAWKALGENDAPLGCRRR